VSHYTALSQRESEGKGYLVTKYTTTYIHSATVLSPCGFWACSCPFLLSLKVLSQDNISRRSVQGPRIHGTVSNYTHRLQQSICIIRLTINYCRNFRSFNGAPKFACMRPQRSKRECSSPASSVLSKPNTPPPYVPK